MAKPISIPKFANSLVEFLINALADKYGDARHYAYRYNNLKVYMDPTKVSEPHFYVSLGISEACFTIEAAKKIEGSLGNEDNYIGRWAGRANIYNELKLQWKAIKEAIAAEEEDDVSKKSAAIATLNKTGLENDRVHVDITGTGIDKTKRAALNKQLKAFKKDTEKVIKNKRKKRVRFY